MQVAHSDPPQCWLITHVGLFEILLISRISIGLEVWPLNSIE